MSGRCLVTAACVLLGSSWAAEAASPGWQAYADCAISYHLNSQDKTLNKSRSNGMISMIAGQSRDYEVAAIARYRATNKAPQKAAVQAVGTYMNANQDRFMAMSKAGKLEGFIDHCPQI